MKRLLVCLFLVAACVALPRATDAQSVRVFNASKATLSNTDTAYITCDVDDEGKSIQVVVKRTSGTAAGKALLLVSNDGVNYLAPPGADTITLTNAATNAKLWTIAPLYYNSYQVKVISSGSTTLTAKAYLNRRKL